MFKIPKMKNWSLYKSKLYTKYIFYKKIIFFKLFSKDKTSSLSFNLSKNEINGLEISVKSGCGLFCDYCPQDKYIESYKTKFSEQEKTLTEETFMAVMQNVPNSTYMKWTGFTEPLDSKLFPVFSKYLRDNGYKQQISTTLHGNLDSVAWFCENLSFFNGITLHLPDDSGFMKSRVNDKYLSRLTELLENAFKLGLGEERLIIFLIGDSFHKDIKSLLDDHLERGLIKSSQIQQANILNTRNSTIDPSKLRIKNVTTRDFIKESSRKQKNYYCSYRRLNSAVLLPNGQVTLCCQDYNLDFILGNLKTEKLNDLYNKIESDDKLSNMFLKGEFFPCTKCEHYKPTDSSFSGHLRPSISK